MAGSRAAEKLAIRAELAAARYAMTDEVRGLSEAIRERSVMWQRTAASPVKILLTIAGSWLAYRAVKKRQLPMLSLGVLLFRWIRPRLTTWLLRRV